MNTLKEISKEIIESKKIGITYHASPDGDAVGSALALLNGIKSLNKDAYLISKDIIPANLQYLTLSEEATGKLNNPLEDTDTIIVVDCGSYNRISAYVDDYKGKIINLDHHVTNEIYGEKNYVDIKASATAEIVYELLLEMGFEFEKNEDSLNVGTCLYTALVTDTGSFKYSNVTERTHKIASVLIKVGVDNRIIHQNLFENKSFQQVKFLGKVLNNVELLFNDKISLIKIPLKFAAELGGDIGDTSDIIASALQIKGVEIAILIKETENGSKISLRSKNFFDVREIAERLGGGGHIKAAGITLKNACIEEAEDLVLNEIEKEF